ncbi:bestrophin-like domain [Pontibacter ruber]
MASISSRTDNNPKPENEGQGIGKFFGSIPAWALFLIIVLACVVIDNLGAWIGHLRYLSGRGEPEQYLNTAVGSILGLLAFMLGFTFSLTWTRFSSRTTLVIQQAKAIKTCYLYTDMLPEKQKSETKRVLKEYIDTLLIIPSSTELEPLLEKLEELHASIWRQTTTLAAENLDSELRSLFVGSVVEIINISLEREIIALRFRIPDPIWSSLLLLSALGMFAFGYQTGITDYRKIFELPLLPIAFSLVIVLIADLNSSGVQRRFKVTQLPLLEVKKLMDKDLY